MTVGRYPVMVSRPAAATSLLMDLRNFTPLLIGSGRDVLGGSQYCHYLGEVYSHILECCLTALPEQYRGHPPVQINSTGDGALIVFTGEWHFGFGYLTAILLDAALTRGCCDYNAAQPVAGLPGTGFGIGVESGTVSRIVAQPPAEWSRPAIDTVIGDCINVAARAEGVSKLIDGANTVISDETVDQVARALYGENFRDKVRAESQCQTDEERYAVRDTIRDLARKMCIVFVHRHHLKGVAASVPLYRLARSELRPSAPRLRELLGRLVRGNEDHLAEVTAYLDSKLGPPPAPPAGEDGGSEG